MIQFTFDLYPENGKINQDIPYGYKFRGVIMKWLAESNPELGDAFHQPGEVRPYAINSILKRKKGKIEFILTSYNEKLSDTVLHDLLQSKRVNLTVDHQNFIIAQISFERPNLVKMKAHARPLQKLQVQFITPIYLNTLWGDYPVRFPLPSLFFGNLVNIWNDINEEALHIDREAFIDWIDAHVYISGYKMRSAKRDIGKPKPVVGGLGNATYRVTKINRNYYKQLLTDENKQYDIQFVNDHYSNNCKWLDVLCKLGTYTNVGGNRTAGMGVIRYWVKKELTEESLLKKTH